MKNARKLNKAVLLGSVIGSISLGNSMGVYAIEPSPFQIGNFDLIPTLKVDALRMSNLLYSADNEIDTNVLTVMPKIQALLNNGPNEYLFEAQITDGTYSESGEDDYTDWLIGTSAHMELNSRNLLELNASFLSTHEARGTGYSEGTNIPVAPEEYEEVNVGMSYEYGANDAIGRLVFDLSHYGREFSTNRLATQFRDRDDLRFGVGFFLSVLSRADILLEYRHFDLDYVTSFDAISNLDSTEDYLYLGLAWEATASISGSVRVGYGQKEFDSSAREDTDLPSWEIDLTWQPLTYSSVTLSANKRFNETNGLGNSIERRDFILDWNHTWSARINSGLRVTLQNDDYDGINRGDELTSIDARLNYSFARWLDFNVSVSKSDKDSSSPIC